MDSIELSDKKKEIAKTAWEYMLKTGLSNASIGGLCRETEYGESTLYHYYKNKDDIWITAGKYGISKVVNNLLKFTLNHTNDIRKYFDTLLDEIEKYKYELRLAIQITTSPLFGERMREKAKDFRIWYEKYANELINIFGCSYLQAEIFIYSVIAFVIDYAIWDDKEKTQMLLDNLKDRTIEKLNLNKPQIFI